MCFRAPFKVASGDAIFYLSARFESGAEEHRRPAGNGSDGFRKYPSPAVFAFFGVMADIWLINVKNYLVVIIMTILRG